MAWVSTPQLQHLWHQRHGESLGIVYCREIKEFQSQALECLAASQLSYEEINSIVVSFSFPYSPNQQQLLYASTFSLQGVGAAPAGSTEILQHKLYVSPALIAYTTPSLPSGTAGSVTFFMHPTRAWS